jgi:hypothetical protein
MKLERYKSGKTKWPKVLNLTVLLRDWQRGRRQAKAHPGTAIGTTCAVAQTLIREVNEDRRFHVGISTIWIEEKDERGWWREVARYRPDNRVQEIIEAFDNKSSIPDELRRGDGLPVSLTRTKTY